jgi:hypothetical protein
MFIFLGGCCWFLSIIFYFIIKLALIQTISFVSSVRVTNIWTDNWSSLGVGGGGSQPIRTAEIFKTPPFIYSIFLKTISIHIHMYFRWKSWPNHIFYNNIVSCLYTVATCANSAHYCCNIIYLSMSQQPRMLTTGDHFIISIKCNTNIRYFIRKWIPTIN